MINEKELTSLISLLDDPDIEIQHQIEERLLTYGNDAVFHLENAWEKSLDAVVQERIINVIHKIQYQNVIEDLTLWYHTSSFDLLKGILIVNKYQYPDINEDKIIVEIEKIKRDIWVTMMYEVSPEEQVKLINQIFYNVYGFRGNTTNHKDPLNSFISQVLESKKGNQISLAIIYSIIAQKLEIPIYGVNLPQHFILCYQDTTGKYGKLNEVLFYINVFNKGQVFGKRDIDMFLKQLKIQSYPNFYEPCTNIHIIKRVLRNLISSYEELGSTEKVKEIKGLLNVFED